MYVYLKKKNLYLNHNIRDFFKNSFINSMVFAISGSPNDKDVFPPNTEEW